MKQAATLEGKLITVRQKDSIAHTKFFLTVSGKPMPMQNFARAREWAQQELLSAEAAAFVQAIIAHVDHGKPLQFRGQTGKAQGVS